MKILSLAEVRDAKYPNLTEWLATCQTIFGRRVQYRGSGTVWRRYPTGERAPTRVEVALSAAATSAEWARPTK